MKHFGSHLQDLHSQDLLEPTGKCQHPFQRSQCSSMQSWILSLCLHCFLRTDFIQKVKSLHSDQNLSPGAIQRISHSCPGITVKHTLKLSYTAKPACMTNSDKHPCVPQNTSSWEAFHYMYKGNKILDHNIKKTC